MYSKVKILGHPLHPMLIVFPVTFYVTTFAGFLAYSVTYDPFWFRVAVTANIAGVVLAIVAAIPGFIDWSVGVPSNTAAKRTGFRHLLLNVSALSVFAINALMQFPDWSSPAPSANGAVLLSFIGVTITGLAGYLGWTLVQTHHVGVQLNPEQERLERQNKRTGKWTTA